MNEQKFENILKIIKTIIDNKLVVYIATLVLGIVLLLLCTLNSFQKINETIYFNFVFITFIVVCIFSLKFFIEEKIQNNKFKMLIKDLNEDEKKIISFLKRGGENINAHDFNSDYQKTVNCLVRKKIIVIKESNMITRVEPYFDNGKRIGENYVLENNLKCKISDSFLEFLDKNQKFTL